MLDTLIAMAFGRFGGIMGLSEIGKQEFRWKLRE